MGGQAEHELSPPVAEGGAKPNDLYAETNASLTQAATVEVVDNNTGETLISCKVEAAKTSCGATGGTHEAAAGHHLAVRIVGPTMPANIKGWQVTFRW
jgi:hypothetical protein